MPKSFKIFHLKQLLETSFSGPSPDCEEREIDDHTEWGVLKTSAITVDGWFPQQNKILPREYWGLSKLCVRDGDILITKAGPRNRVAVSTVVSGSPKNLIVSGKMIALRVNRNLVHSHYLNEVLKTPKVQKYLHDRSTGMAESQVNFANETLLNMPVPIPDIFDQEKVVTILSEVDYKIRCLALENQKLSLMFEGVLDDHFNNLQDSDFVSLNETIVRDSPICYGIVQPGDYDDKGIPVVAINNMDFSSPNSFFKVSNKLNSLYTRSQIKPDDLLISVKGTVGRVSIVPSGFNGNISRDVARIRTKEKIVALYLQAFFESNLGRQTVSDSSGGSTRLELPIGKLNLLRVPRPNLNKINELIPLMSSLRKQRQTIQVESQKTHQLKAGLIFNIIGGMDARSQ